MDQIMSAVDPITRHPSSLGDASVPSSRNVNQGRSRVQRRLLNSRCAYTSPSVLPTNIVKAESLVRKGIKISQRKA